MLHGFSILSINLQDISSESHLGILSEELLEIPAEITQRTRIKKNP